MSVGTEPVRWQRPRTGSEGATQEWLDALANGLCSAEEFLGAMREQFEGNRDGNWEVLSLLDQYYRRGKIRFDLFRSLKSRLEDTALGRESKPVPRLPPQTSSTVTAPAVVTPPAAAVPPRAAVPTRAAVSSPAAAWSQAAASSPASSVAAPSPSAAGSPQPTPSSPAAALPQPAPPSPRTAIRALAIGDVLRNRYRIQGVLGHGGMGTVFEAIDEYRLDLLTPGQRLAIKVLHTAVTERRELLSELQREFQNLQLLSHPNVVRVHEFDRDGDLAFFTMELLRGSLLSRVLSTRNGATLPRAYALAIIRDVGAAISHAHSRGVVHGDVNPQNIFITSDGELRVLDFGASHTLHHDIWNPDGGLQPHAPVATPGYASCQVLAGQRPDARDDLFAFACVSYVLLCGQHPFPKLTAVQAREQRSRIARPPGLSGRQWRVLREGLRWERDRRPSDVLQWLTRFDIGAAAPHIPPLAMLVNAPPPKKSRLALAAAIVGLALLAAGGYWVLTDDGSLAGMVKGWGDQVSALINNEGTSPGEPTGTQRTPASEPALPAASNRADENSAVDQSAAANRNAALTQNAPVNRNISPNPRSSQAASAPQPAAARVAAAAPAQRADPAAADQGAAHIEMAADTVDVVASETTAVVTVRRRGNLRGDASFRWWTESGTAKPATDFTPSTPRVEEIPNGRNSVTLSIPVSNRPRSQARSFYVVIDQTESGATLGARTLTMVTLLPSD
jgi:serine/threonine protein kinase